MKGRDTSMQRNKRKVIRQDENNQDVDDVDQCRHGKFTEGEMLPTGEEGNCFKKGGLFIFDRFF